MIFKKLNRRSFIIGFICATAIALLAVLYACINMDHDSYMPVRETTAGCNGTTSGFADSIDQDDLIDKFPYSKYLESKNYEKILCLQADVAAIYEVTKDKRLTQEIFASALTTHLHAKIDRIYEKYNADSMIILMQWVEKFQDYAEIDSSNPVIYRVVFRDWMNFIVHKLEDYSHINPSLKYDFKYKLLVSKCAEKKFSTAVKISPSEKVIDNISRGKWGHLMESFWNQASIFSKIILAFVLLLFLYGIYCIIYKYFIK